MKLWNLRITTKKRRSYLKIFSQCSQIFLHTIFHSVDSSHISTLSFNSFKGDIQRPLSNAVKALFLLLSRSELDLHYTDRSVCQFSLCIHSRRRIFFVSSMHSCFLQLRKSARSKKSRRRNREKARSDGISNPRERSHCQTIAKTLELMTIVAITEHGTKNQYP